MILRAYKEQVNNIPYLATQNYSTFVRLKINGTKQEIMITGLLIIYIWLIHGSIFIGKKSINGIKKDLQGRRKTNTNGNRF